MHYTHNESGAEGLQQILHAHNRRTAPPPMESLAIPLSGERKPEPQEQPVNQNDFQPK